jgi:hypothetical protein
MTVINRLATVSPGFGSPIVNDATQLSQNVALSGTVQQTKTLSGIFTFSRGYVRVKIYAGGGTSPTLLNLQAIVSDGTTFVDIGGFTPVVASAPALSVTPAGTQLATNGSITSGAAILTSASAPFTPAMVGLPISLSNAGAAGVVLYTTILSYQSATQVTLAANAGATTTTATVVLTSAYGNGGTLGTSVGGIDFLFEFIVDLSCTQVSILTTLGGTTPTALMDVEIVGTI